MDFNLILFTNRTPRYDALFFHRKFGGRLDDLVPMGDALLDRVPIPSFVGTRLRKRRSTGKERDDQEARTQ